MSSDHARSVAKTIGVCRVVREQAQDDSVRDALTDALDVLWEHFSQLDADAPVEEPDELDPATIRQRVVTIDAVQERVGPGEASTLAVARETLDDRQAAMQEAETA